MALARNDLLDHVDLKPDQSALRDTPARKVADMKVLGVLVTHMRPIRNLLAEYERLNIPLGSLPEEYDGMVKIIEARGNISLLEAKEISGTKERQFSKQWVNRNEDVVRTTIGTIVNRKAAAADLIAVETAVEGDATVMEAVPTSRNSDASASSVVIMTTNVPTVHKPQDKVVKKSSFFRQQISCLGLDYSGAISLMTGELDDFVDLEKLAASQLITVSICERLPARAKGKVKFVLNDGKSVCMTYVLYIPGITRKLISASALPAKGVQLTFGSDECVISHGCKLLDASVWYARLEHIPAARMGKLAEAVVRVPDLPDLKEDDGPCHGCACGKLSVKGFACQSGSQVESTNLPEIIHSDAMGPMQPSSRGSARYVVCFVDDFSRFVCVYTLKTKSDMTDKFAEFILLLENQTQCRVKVIRIDNGGEYTAKKLAQFCLQHGIFRQTSATYTPQQNSVPERMTRTIVEMARSMLHYQRLNQKCWGEAIMTAVYLLTRLPRTARRDTTLYELVYGVKSDSGNLRVFGSK
ncbi:LOW QUALITY PROTEIN: Retroelement [Phytophthora megakarya]|uniref:Retroelement n=1 Tax=Phytophthora megakarya TaxID=4795 RepID=A0A225VKZ8_9STRA|nr:LOW QUALITY PROTEIN: Retroelement [Phytophthora megakarya]